MSELDNYVSDIVIRGKKAEKYKELKVKYGFLNIDIYMMSAVLGFINHKKDIQDNSNPSMTESVPRTVLNSRSGKLNLLSQIMILSEELDVDVDQAIKLAFKTKQKPEDKLERRELLFDYSLGGIDILYDMLSNTTYENQIDNLKNIVEKYSDTDLIGEETIEEFLTKEML